VPNNHNMFLSAPRERSAAAGGMQGTARLAGQTLGVILISLLLSLASVDQAPRIGLALAALLVLAGGLVSLLRAGPIARLTAFPTGHSTQSGRLPSVQSGTPL
jgi:MFS transporter, DHA2 family, multidrug resistance protein